MTQLQFMNAEIERLRAELELAKACNETLGSAMAIYWKILAPGYEGEMDFAEMLQAKLAELAVVKSSRREKPIANCQVAGRLGEAGAEGRGRTRRRAKAAGCGVGASQGSAGNSSLRDRKLLLLSGYRGHRRGAEGA